MKRFSLLFAVVVLCVAPGLGAQRTGANEEILFQMEVSRGGTVLARPTIRVAKSGTAVPMKLSDGTTFSVTPTRIDTDTVRLVLELTVGVQAVEVKASMLPLS